MEFIQNLKSKPEATRKKILFLALTVSMVLVSFVWVYGMSDRFNQSFSVDNDVSNTSSPLKLLSNSFINAYNNISASVGSISFSKDQKAVGDESSNIMIVK